ncbi:peptidylprolyl isomerase [Hoeflea prorocentri]|uniref:Parvulin-like PPIase n=2 Tax=Hoeflea prorocentri TaxID=1922333 RepID=A0A9X3ZJ77_9HYPH|nr:peptidylprolyl isomerase [Hoeflea prorocentri]MCY6383667.1 peptidylprolyl isomerase [Hoeflea prorocentri]MDA5401467.1 peptidylprolyl isomerase [Hoeflea prorocentri]
MKIVVVAAISEEVKIMHRTMPWRAAIVALTICAGAGAAAQDAEDKVIATIGGKPVYQSELTFAESDLDPQFSRLPADQRTAAALSALLDIKLMAQQAEGAGLGKDEAFQRRLSFLKDRALHNEYFRTKVVDGLTDDAVRARYEQEIAATEPEQEIKARHILVDSEEQAKAIIADLDGGTDFVELAKEKSTGPSGPQGGDLGYFTRGRMVPEFEEAAFALEPGSYTKEPIKTQFGWHVIKVEDRRDTPPPQFEQVADQIRRVLLQEQYLALIQEARDAIEVEVTDQDLQSLLDKANAQGQN